MKELLELVWKIMNTPAVITAFAGLLLYGLNRLYDTRPGWSKYEGTIISAIRFAEKAVPDNAENKSLNRLDKALKYVLAVYEEKEGKAPTKAVKAELLEGIQLVHNDLETSGGLGKK